MKARRHIAGIYRNEKPFLRMMIPFICGIVVQVFDPVSFRYPAVALIGITSLLLFHSYHKKLAGNWKIRAFAGIAIHFAFFFSGILVTYFNTETNDPNHFQYHVEPEQILLAKIIKPVSEKPGSFKTNAEIVALRKNNEWKYVHGKVLVYLKRDSASANLEYGDLICFSTMPAPIIAPLNPEEFNYKRFLSFHQIYQQVYLSSGSWFKVNGNAGNTVISLAYKIRNQFIKILSKTIKGQREFTVACALVVGYDEEVDQELIRAYSSAGALHVLSVSGMHVGLIYQGLFLILGFLNRKKWSSHFLHTFLIGFIWFYAFLTGFSPSVARSAVMITVVIMGKWLGRNSNAFNTLIVTAFALLLFNPYYITEVGFQLSFFAVWGIIYFHPKVFLLLEPNSRLMHWVWEITSISLSAQLMTFPLGLLYFHQFPNLFMLSNLVVIPLSGIIIYACIAVLVFSPLTLVSIWIAKLTGFLLWILNTSVLIVDQIPGSVLNRIYISVIETWIIYLLLACITSFFLSRKPIYLQAGLIMVAWFITGQLLEKSKNLHQRQIIIYAIPKQHAMDLIDGVKHIFIADNELVNNKASMLFHINHNWWSNGMKESTLLPKEMLAALPVYREKGMIINRNFIFFGDKKILLADKNFRLDSKLASHAEIPKLKIDYLIISDNSVKNLKEIVDFIECKKIIIDSSNSKYNIEKWIEESGKLGISCYPVLQNGAFIENF